MAASKKNIVETFTKVSGIGESYAEQMYDELGLRSLDDLIAAAKAGKVKTLSGIGPAKEKSILESATELLSKDSAPSPAKKTTKANKAPAKAADAKKEAKKETKKETKKAAPPKAAKKETAKPKKAAPEASAKKEAPKAEAKKEEPAKPEPKRAPRSTASDFDERAKNSKSSPGKRPTIPGLIFKIGKKLVSRLLS